MVEINLVNLCQRDLIRFPIHKNMRVGTTTYGGHVGRLCACNHRVP